MGPDLGRSFSTRIILKPWRRGSRTSIFTSRFPHRCRKTTGPAIAASSTKLSCEQYLQSHENPRAVEYYLCGPPLMIKACLKMLKSLRVDASQIAFDEF